MSPLLSRPDFQIGFVDRRSQTAAGRRYGFPRNLQSCPWRDVLRARGRSDERFEWCDGAHSNNDYNKLVGESSRPHELCSRTILTGAFDARRWAQAAVTRELFRIISQGLREYAVRIGGMQPIAEPRHD